VTLPRPIVAADHAALLALNNAHAVELSAEEPGRFGRILAAAAFSAAIGREGDPEGFLLAFDDRTPVQGPNHAWFLARHGRFLYVDRVCVAARARRRGLAGALYQAAFAAARARGAAWVCCEINTEPDNPASDAFHDALGFVEVGRRFLEDRGKAVRYLERAP